MKDFVMDLPGNVAFILDKMKSAGYEAHIVGGSVRDAVLGRERGDYDITTNALPEETKAVFDGYRIIETGIKHGTVTLVLDSEPYEITTYRLDGDYKDNRHPDSVTFTSLLGEDLMRRDFTVNAMAYNPDTGITDLFGGRQDSADRLIRAVGDPYKRFDEDALRILRALRFAAVLDFEIESETAVAVRSRAHLLSSISKERIYTEFKKLVMGVSALKILTEYADVIAPLTCGLLIENVPKKELFDKSELQTRFAALFLLNSDSPSEHGYRVLTELKTDKLTRSGVSDTLRVYKDIDFKDETAVLRHLADYGAELTLSALRLGVLIEKFGEREEALYLSALASGKPYAISQLAVRGNDIASLGVRGEKIGEALKKLLYTVIDGRVENEREALLEYLKKTKEV